MYKQHVKLTSEDRLKLETQRKNSQLQARIYKRVVGLLELDSGKTYESASKQADLSVRSLQNLVKRYKSDGLACLIDLPRPGRPIKIDAKQQDQITLLACEDAPEGHSQWSLRLLADKVVELGYCEEISHTQVNNILKKKKIKPHLTKTWCIGVVNAVFLAAMENILRLYRLPYDPDYPVICFDERPCFLIGDVIKGLELKPGQIRKEHYEYLKNGSCVLLMAIEPLTGKRIAKIYDRRRKIEYADFMQLVAQYWSDAIQIRLIQDNLNTHNASSFYENLEAQEAFELAQKFEFHYTPIKGSWLNAVEVEFSAIARGCLGRRIPTKEILEKQILTFVKEREKQQIKINWKFDISMARKKMNSKYTSVNPDNKKYEKT